MGNRHTGQKADYDKTLPKLIESLCGQTSTNFQWLVIDDGSTDDTDSIFEELKKYDLPFQWEYLASLL